MNSKMLFYILKRVLLALLTIWIVITVTFFVMHSIPGGPFASERQFPRKRRRRWRPSTGWTSRWANSM